MNRIIKITFIAAAIAISAGLYAQTPPPPNGGNNPTQDGSIPVGGGAPIAGGVGILLALGTAYGIKKVYQFNKNDNE